MLLIGMVVLQQYNSLSLLKGVIKEPDNSSGPDQASCATGSTVD